MSIEIGGEGNKAGHPVSRRSFLAAGGALTAAALALPHNRLLMPSASAKGAAGDTLTLGLPDSPGALKQVTSYLAAFEKSSGIKINSFTTNTPTGTWVSVFQELSTRLAAGEPVDSAYIATEGMLLFEEQNLLDPLDSYIAADKAATNEFYADVNPQLLANFRELDNLSGHTYFIPIGYNVMGVWYNRALFKKYGVAEPGPGWTWDEFQEAASKVASAPDRYGWAVGTPAPGPFTDIYPWVLTAGGRVLSANQKECVANNPQAIEAATFVRGLVKDKFANEPGGSYNPFVEMPAGRLGMFGGGIWPNFDVTTTPAQTIKDFAIVPWPKKVASGTPVGVGGFPIFKSSKNKAALWEFIKFTFSQDFQANQVALFAGDMPIRQSVARSKAFLSKYPSGTEYFSDELSYSTMIVGVPNGSAVESEMSTVWEQILTGAVTPAAGMASMQTNCTQLMSQKV